MVTVTGFAAVRSKAVESGSTPVTGASDDVRLALALTSQCVTDDRLGSSGVTEAIPSSVKLVQPDGDQVLPADIRHRSLLCGKDIRCAPVVKEIFSLVLVTPSALEEGDFVDAGNEGEGVN